MILFKQGIKSLGFAINGFLLAFRTEHNLRIHLLATFLVLVGAITISVSFTEAAILCIVTGMVWMAELFNTAIEKLCDFICPEKSAAIKVIKDTAAAAVLASAMVAIGTAGFIFIPKL